MGRGWPNRPEWPICIHKMSQNHASTSWTPAKGDVVGWDFVWRGHMGEVKPRPCALLDPVADSGLVVVPLSSFKYGQIGRSVELAWAMPGGGERLSQLFLDSVEFNLVPAEVLVKANAALREPLLWGRMDERNVRTVERRVYGAVISGGASALLRGAMWVAESIYRPVKVVKGEGQEPLRLAHEDGEDLYGKW